MTHSHTPCAECRYFQPVRSENAPEPANDDKRGTCHINPPTGKDGSFPTVKGDDFCGRAEPRTRTPTTFGNASTRA